MTYMMAESSVGPDVSVTVEQNAVVVELPAGVAIDRSDARDINREYMPIVRQDDITRTLTVIEQGTTLTDAGVNNLGRGGPRLLLVASAVR